MPSAPPIELPPVGWHLDNTYAQLPDTLFSRQRPVVVRAPQLVIVNRGLADRLGLDLARLSPEAAAALFAGNVLPEGAEPLAQAYAGHQFGHFNLLGDGRAIVIGEHVAPDGRRFDVQLKGSGQTPYSRRGDGRAALGPMLREYIMSEAMHALGIPTTRSLAVVTTGEPVYREAALPGAILTRVAASHIRIGTFQYAAARRDRDLLRQLADYTIARHDPDLAADGDRYRAVLDRVAERQAALVARWMLVGFIHGVMNTDNMALSGETIDYGPCAFIDEYDPATVFSSIDRQGRYAYGNQPHIAQWNLARLAETMLPLLDDDEPAAVASAEGVLDRFATHFQHCWLAGMRAKLGLMTEEEGDKALAEGLLGWMQQRRADFTNTFRALAEEILPADEAYRDSDFRAWHDGWLARLDRNGAPREAAFALMCRHNPAVIPRNHRVEAALAAATGDGDLTIMHRLLAALAAPYDDGLEFRAYRQPPRDSERVLETFCGT
jgi:uncharacterized protein YdiU (UPF0061 family)